MIYIDHELVKDTKLALKVSYLLHKKTGDIMPAGTFCHIFKALILNEVRELIRRARNISANL